jgi:transcription elongation GreA/GreB family factor
MTAEARRSLIDDVVELRSEVARLAGRNEALDGVAHHPVTTLARRLEVLTGVLDEAEETDERERVVIGCRATLLEEDGRSVTYSLAFPGAGDPAEGLISADSPLGKAVLGSRPGDTVEVDAPAGRRLVTVVCVE